VNLSVEAISQQQSVHLAEGTAVIVPAGNILITISGSRVSEVRLDGRLYNTLNLGGRQVLSHDLSRSTGFHHLQIPPGKNFWFGTEDAKLKLEGVQAMLEAMRDGGFGWSGQLFFSDGGQFREPHVVYGWLDRHADVALSSAEDIARIPRQSLIREVRATDRAGKSLAMGKTMSLLRRKGKELLEQAAEGPIAAMGMKFHAREVIVRSSKMTLDTPANRRVIWLISRISRLIEEVRSQILVRPEAERLQRWLSRSTYLLHQSPLALRGSLIAGPPIARPTIEEQTDTRYAAIYEIAKSFISSFGWAPLRSLRTLYAYVDYADQIYQAFVELNLAKQLNLIANTPGSQPTFKNDKWELYGNSEPPPQVMRSWRSYTGDPDLLRPDFTLLSLQNGSVVLGDAKYRSNGQRGSESSRKDLMFYMSAYNAPRAMLFYPPIPANYRTVNIISAQGRELIEFPVAPSPDLNEFLAANLPAVIARAKFVPAWRD
jgi:hypothetical protein